jgi:hypothetical protein
MEYQSNVLFLPYPTLGEADPGGLGASPQKNNWFRRILLFPEKEAKSVVPLRGKLHSAHNSVVPGESREI